MSTQLEFQFESLPYKTTTNRSHLNRVKRVELDEYEGRDRERCINNDKEFPDSILLEARSQRMGISKAVFCHMPKWEQNLMLADEAVILRQSNWEYEECCWIDWKLHEQRAKSMAEVWAKDFEDFRKNKEQFMDWKNHDCTSVGKRTTRKRLAK